MQQAAATAPRSLTFSATGVVWLKLSVIYLLVGVAMGIAMGATENFTLRPVHAHVNLLGWATVALAGLVYSMFPKAGDSRLAKIHFWLHNTSLPVMMIALAGFLLGSQQFLPVLVVSEFVMAAGILVFAWNVFANVKRA